MVPESTRTAAWWLVNARRTLPVVAGAAVVANLLLAGAPRPSEASNVTAPSPQVSAPLPDAVVVTPPPAQGQPLPLTPPTSPDVTGPVTVRVPVAAPGSIITVNPREGTAQVLPWFDSPYLGHTGSRDGMGNQIDGSSKAADLDVEAAMGLHWTFMEAFWSAFEPDAPTDPKHDASGAWRSFDAFVVESHKRQLYPLVMIAVGGNAGAPPAWAGQRTAGDSAPQDMDALVAFAGKLVARYKPGGTLAQEKGWGTTFGVRAWEMDNEPMNYQTHWGNTQCDYSEFVVKTTKRIKALDPQALVLAPASAHPTGDSAQTFIRNALDANCSVSSETYKKNGVKYAIGPSTDVVSFHMYEEMDGGLNDSMLEDNFSILKGIFDENKYVRQKGWEYAPKQHYWCTECEDFFAASQDPRQATGAHANWAVQWLTRGFALGVEKMTVMDAHLSVPEQQSVALMIRLLPKPAGIREVTRSLQLDPAKVRVFRWTSPVDGRWTYVAWAANGAGDITVSLPVRSSTPIQESRSGGATLLRAQTGKVSVALTGSPGYAPPPVMSPQYSEPVFVVDTAR